MSDEQVVKQFLDNQQFMVVAVTRDDGSPWAVPVRILRHEGAIFAWDSHVDTVHSQAIARGSAVAITIFSAESGQQVGFYAEGTATVNEKGDGFARYTFTASKAYLNDATFVKREVRL